MLAVRLAEWGVPFCVIGVIRGAFDKFMCKHSLLLPRPAATPSSKEGESIWAQAKKMNKKTMQKSEILRTFATLFCNIIPMRL